MELPLTINFGAPAFSTRATLPTAIAWVPAMGALPTQAQVAQQIKITVTLLQTGVIGIIGSQIGTKVTCLEVDASILDLGGVKMATAEMKTGSSHPGGEKEGVSQWESVSASLMIALVTVCAIKGAATLQLLLHGASAMRAGSWQTVRSIRTRSPTDWASSAVR